MRKTLLDEILQGGDEAVEKVMASLSADERQEMLLCALTPDGAAKRLMHLLPAEEIESLIRKGLTERARRRARGKFSSRRYQGRRIPSDAYGMVSDERLLTAIASH